MRTPTLALALVLGNAAALAAQVAATGSITLASSYVWRGLTLVNRPVLQPEVSASAGPITMGIWGNLEPCRYRGEQVISVLAGRRAPGFTEVDPYAEVAARVRGADVALGVYAYLYTHAAGYETEPNTAEVYARAALAGAWPVSLNASYDVHSLKGVYLEAALERPAPTVPALQLALRLGASFGETSGPETFYYARNGLTHAEGGVAWPLKLHGAELTPSATVVLGIDPETRWVTPARSRTAKGLLGVSVAWPAGDD